MNPETLDSTALESTEEQSSCQGNTKHSEDNPNNPETTPNNSDFIAAETDAAKNDSGNLQIHTSNEELPNETTEENITFEDNAEKATCSQTKNQTNENSFENDENRSNDDLKITKEYSFAVSEDMKMHQTNCSNDENEVKASDSIIQENLAIASSNAVENNTTTNQINKRLNKVDFSHHKSANFGEKATDGGESFSLFHKNDAAEMSSITSSENSISFELRFTELDFPGVERIQIVDEIRNIYSQNRKTLPHFKEAYCDHENVVFRDFVEEYIFILRNTFTIPEDSERFSLLINEVLSGPVLYHEYKKLLLEEVSHPRFFWGVSSYAEIDTNGDGKITEDEIASKFGKSKKKMTKLKAKERTKDDHISLTEFLDCWDHAGKQSRAKSKQGTKGEGQTEDQTKGQRKNKAFKHDKTYNSNDFPGVTMDQIADELRQAYKANKEILDHFKEDYAKKENPLFQDFVEELLFVKRNVAGVIPADQEQFNRLLDRLFQYPVTYSEYCSVLSHLPVNKFGWGLDSFAKLDLDSNGSISPKEVEAAVGQSKRKQEKFEALEKNNDGKISLAEFLHCWEHEVKAKTLPYKVMMVVTNNADLGTTGRKTGYYLPEVAHPYHVFTEAGLDVVFVSPRGGYAPMDPSSYEAYMDDLICANFIEDPEILHKLDNTLNPANIDPSSISVVFYAGGHGPMWDVAFNREIATIARQVYKHNAGIIGAVCHGTCGLLPITLKAATKPTLLENRKVTSFTNDEEEMVFNEDTWNIMNFKLETKLTEAGAEFVKGEPFACNVVNHKGIVTGQNPQSSTKCAQVIVEELAAKIANKDAFNKLL